MLIHPDDIHRLLSVLNQIYFAEKLSKFALILKAINEIT